MDVGTIDLIEETEDRQVRLTGRSGGSNTPGGGGDGRDPGGGGGDGPAEGGVQPQRDAFKPGISRILTGFLLLVVVMTFAGLIAAYVVIATNNVAEWRPFDLPIQVWMSTGIILISSFTYHLAKMGIDRHDQPAAKKWLTVTTVFGASFVSSQILAWVALTGRGFYLQGNPYAGFFYIMTAVHAVHVLGGISALGAILLRTWNPINVPEQVERTGTLAQVVGWYWHFMGALWIVLFVLLGFWK